jgi:hypothetical protein
MLYSFFWVIPLRPNFKCQRFGTICLFHLHRPPPPRPSTIRLAQISIVPNLYPYKYPSNLASVILLVHTIYADGTVCSEFTPFFSTFTLPVIIVSCGWPNVHPGLLWNPQTWIRNLMFCWPCFIVYQYNEPNVMLFLFNLLRIKASTLFEHYMLILRRRYTSGTWYIASVLCQLAAPGLKWKFSTSWGWASNARKM